MSSRRSAIVDAIVTALGAATATDLRTGATYTKPSGLTVLRAQSSPLTSDDLPAMVVRRIQEDTTRAAAASKDRRALLVRVDCYAETTADGAPNETALDALTSWAVQAVMNTASLRGGAGALCHDTTDVLTKWEESDTDAVYSRAAMGFSCDYITAAGNPDAA